jgi:hypothetical protein
MGGVPRSQRLLSFEFTAGGNSPTWTSPADFITLVKSLYAYCGATAGGTLYLYASSPETGGFKPVALLTLTAGAVSQWEGWFVLNPGDAIILQTSVAPTDVWVSGAVLAGAPQFPPAT